MTTGLTGLWEIAGRPRLVTDQPWNNGSEPAAGCVRVDNPSQISYGTREPGSETSVNLQNLAGSASGWVRPIRPATNIAVADWNASTILRWNNLPEIPLMNQAAVVSGLIYGYGKRGQQKKVAQHKRRGRCTSICVRFTTAVQRRTIVWEASISANFCAGALGVTLFRASLSKLDNWRLIDNASFKSQACCNDSNSGNIRVYFLFFLSSQSLKWMHLEDQWLHLNAMNLLVEFFETNMICRLPSATHIEAKFPRGNYQGFIFNSMSSMWNDATS